MAVRADAPQPNKATATMLLAIDAGNTNFTFAIYAAGGNMLHSWRCRTDAGRTADEYAAWFYQLLSIQGLDMRDIGAAILSSVVPEANFHLFRFCRRTLGVEAMLVGDPSVRMNLNVRLDRPSEVGADRLVNAVATIRDHGAPAVVIDFGTATTFDVIDGNGDYCGGAIAPGLQLSMDALHRAAAKLPRITVGRTESAIGRDTASAMRAGVYWGYVGLVEGMIRRIADEMGGAKPVTVATGGLAALFAGETGGIDVIDEDLTLRGLLYIYQMNASSAGNGRN